MANAIERRLSALEKAACPAERSLTVVLLEPGEDAADGLTRERYAADPSDVIFVSFVAQRCGAKAAEPGELWSGCDGKQLAHSAAAATGQVTATQTAPRRNSMRMSGATAAAVGGSDTGTNAGPAGVRSIPPVDATCEPRRR